MKTIGYTTAFHRDCRRITKGLGADAVDEALQIIERLAAGETLPTRFRDHRLRGQWKDCRECHIRPDLVLIYRRSGSQHLEVLRLGSHGQLGL